MEVTIRLKPLQWLVAVGCLLTGCNALSTDSADDTKMWQGTWKMVATTYDGAPQTGDMEWIALPAGREESPNSRGRGI